MSCTSSNAYDVVLLLYCNMHVAALVVLSRELSVRKKKNSTVPIYENSLVGLSC